MTPAVTPKYAVSCRANRDASAELFRLAVARTSFSAKRAAISLRYLKQYGNGIKPERF
jgi:hypothetical protein